MMCSANEVMTLATKAARGGGAPPAQASMFGQAALCHLMAEADADDIVAALDALPDGPILTVPLAFARMMETATGDVVETAFMTAEFGPLLHSYIAAQPCRSETTRMDRARLHVRLFLTEPNRPRPVSRVNLPDALADHMTRLAAKILVPESDASRLSGAGAGLTDND